MLISIQAQLLSEDKILTIKSNKAEVVKCISESKDNSWLKDFFHEENPFTKSKLYVEDFNLIIGDNNDELSKYDLENAILLHKMLKLTDSQACDERLWISLCFGEFYDYMKYRWSVEKKTNFEKSGCAVFCFYSGRYILFYSGSEYDGKRRNGIHIHGTGPAAGGIRGYEWEGC